MARLLLRGTTGIDVKELQAALNFHIRQPAEPLNPDGIFGPLTQARVREFQRLAKIGIDGIVGPNTNAALYRTITVASESTITRKPTADRSVSRIGPSSAGGSRSSLVGFPGLGQVSPANPDFIPPSKRSPQAGAGASKGFGFEMKLVFDPLAKPSEGEKPLKITLTQEIPWPVILSKPFKLEFEASSSGGGNFELEAKLSRPITELRSRRIELTPYFFTGGGVEKNHYKEMNVGAGAKIRLKLIEFGPSLTFALQADGGAKAIFKNDTGQAEFKGFFTTGLIVGGEF